MKPSVTTLVAVFVALGTLPSTTGAQGNDQYHQKFSNLAGQVMLDNPRLVVQKFIIQPGQSEGTSNHPGDQLEVFIKGGVLTRASRSVFWKDGAVVWHGAERQPQEGRSNTGKTPIEVIWVTLKPVSASAPSAPGQKPKYFYVNYPQIPGEDILENDLVIVQRFLVAPGQFEGVHAHPPDQLYIHVKGGRWEVRSKNPPPPRPPNPNRPAGAGAGSPDGSIGWYHPIDISEEHQSGNVGDAPIDLIWITLKK